MSSVHGRAVLHRGEVVGIGIDVVEFDEVRANLSNLGDRYLHRVFTDAELNSSMSSEDPVPQLAAVFAAKEATLKAMHIETLRPPWTSIEVLVGQRSAPVNLLGPARELATRTKVDLVTVSTTCDIHKAAAVAVATAKPVEFAQ